MKILQLFFMFYFIQCSTFNPNDFTFFYFVADDAHCRRSLVDIGPLLHFPFLKSTFIADVYLININIHA